MKFHKIFDSSGILFCFLTKEEWKKQRNTWITWISWTSSVSQALSKVKLKLSKELDGVKFWPAVCATMQANYSAVFALSSFNIVGLATESDIVLSPAFFFLVKTCRHNATWLQIVRSSCVMLMSPQVASLKQRWILIFKLTEVWWQNAREIVRKKFLKNAKKQKRHLLTLDGNCPIIAYSNKAQRVCKASLPFKNH